MLGCKFDLSGAKSREAEQCKHFKRIVQLHDSMHHIVGFDEALGNSSIIAYNVASIRDEPACSLQIAIWTLCTL